MKQRNTIISHRRKHLSKVLAIFKYILKIVGPTKKYIKCVELGPNE